MREILVVEDDPDAEAFALMAIKRCGVPARVEVARSGNEALDKLLPEDRSQHEPLRPSLILLDLKMPRMDGLEVLRRLRAAELTSTVPIVMVTTSERPESVDEAYRLGASGYILKRSHFSDFCDDVNSVINYWLRTVQLPQRDDSRSPFPSIHRSASTPES